MRWQLADRVLDVGPRPLVLGIVNVTPDSFSDGGRFLDVEAAVAHALRLVQDGADLLDIGGESTRPGSLAVDVEEEIRRVVPAIAALAAQTTVPLSVDTSKAEVARQAFQAGATILNDVTALTGDPAMAGVVRDSGAGVILMHMQGTPATMQDNPRYGDVVAEIAEFFEARLHALAEIGIAVDQAALDPGFGFGKTVEHNLQILARLKHFQSFGRPVCLGVSRKGFIGRLLGRAVDERLAGSLAVVGYAAIQQAAQIVRVHDVRETCDTLRLLAAIQEHV